MDKLTELVLLLQEQATLQSELFSKRLLRLQMQAGADLAKHKRDQHNFYWDQEMFLGFEKKRDAEIDKLHDKLGEIQKRIDELKKELAPAAA